MKKIGLLSIVLMALTITALGTEPLEENIKKDNSIKWNGSVSMQNQHYWRGMQTGSGLSFEAGASLSLSDGLTAGIWNGTALNSSYKEIDFYLTYSTHGYSFSVLDYYCPRDAVFSNEFGDLNETSTPHLVDIQVGYYPDHFPFSIMVSTMVWGDDLDGQGKNNYSTYIELAYNNTIEDMTTQLLVGYNVWQSMYSESAGIVNIEATADYKIMQSGSFSLNCNTRFIYNPIRTDIYFGGGISVKRH